MINLIIIIIMPLHFIILHHFLKVEFDLEKFLILQEELQ